MNERDILLWLDDVRKPPTSAWKWVEDAATAIEVLKTKRVLFASLDHDLAPVHYTANPNFIPGAHGTGYEVAEFLEFSARSPGGDPEVLPPDGVRVHSMNPDGSRRMIAAIVKAYGQDFQMDTKYGVLPWFLQGQYVGWWKGMVTPEERDHYYRHWE
jgi:hypothetical protein